MKHKKIWVPLLLSALVLIPVLIFFGDVLSNAEKPEGAKAVFYVS